VLTACDGLVPGAMVTAKVVDTEGVDLVAEPLGTQEAEVTG
jgi:ribosomal protein S12 methylthiotransferase